MYAHRSKLAFQAAVAVTIATCTLGARADDIRVPGDQPTIQEAIDIAQGDDMVIVAPGRYNEAIDLKGKSITLRSEKGPSVTVLDGWNKQDSVIKCISGEGPSTRIEGFTVTGGTGYGGLYSEEETVGGGMACVNSSPTVSNCIFVANRAGYHGGGLFIGDRSHALILNCTIRDNEAERGGGIFNMRGEPIIRESRLMDNNARYGGGGVYNYATNARIEDCMFRQNRARFNGGAIYDYDSRGSLVRCTFNDNIAMYNGNAIYRGFRSGTAVGGECKFITIHDDIAGTGGYMIARGRPMGACCIGAGCLIVDEEACVKAGGAWLGSRSTCDDQALVACPAPVEGDINADGIVDMMDLVLLMTTMKDTGN